MRTRYHPLLQPRRMWLRWIGTFALGCALLTAMAVIDRYKAEADATQKIKDETDDWKADNEQIREAMLRFVR